MSCCNNSSSNQEGMLIVNKAREAAACAEANCASSFTNATNAATSATNAAASAAAAAASAELSGIYLGAKAVAPTTDNEGGPLQEGMLYFNTTSNVLFVWNGSAWASTDFNEFTNFTAIGTTTARNLVTRFTDVINVKDFGAVGNGVTDDTAAIATATALLQPVYVPQTASFYNVTALTSAQQKLLYGPGIIKIAGVQIQISSTPFINNETAHIRVYNQELQPSKWSSVDGSLFNGAASISAKRTGGFGSYGLSLTEYVVADAIPSNEFDVGVTSWVTAQNFNGGSAYGMWCGANTPSSLLSQTYANGSAIGMEINVGNRWADFGLLSDIGVTQYTVGLQIVPDVLPAPDGNTPSVYPGSFGFVIAPSVHGHKWWVGNFIRLDTIVPMGIAYQINGGSTAPNATGAMIKGGGYFTRGLDFSNTIFSDQAILFGASQTVSWGGSSMNGTATTFGLTTGGTGEGGIYGNNYAQLALRWSSSGSAPQLGFFGAAAVAKPTVTGSKGGNVALASLITALSNLGLVTDSTS